jgi:hypothetical protein
MAHSSDQGFHLRVVALSSLCGLRGRVVGAPGAPVGVVVTSGAVIWGGTKASAASAACRPIPPIGWL